jgi:VIT1/CCC1 family predicted Fe2+/Mn2+ transporter
MFLRSRAIGLTLKHSVKTGFCFGCTSGIITTLGLMVGLHSGTHLKLAVIGGILVIAVADAFSDAMGIHISEESEDKHSVREIWESTISTFFSKFVFALTFIPAILIFELTTAIVLNVIWGLIALGILSFSIAKSQKIKTWKAVTEHLLIALIVIIIAHFVGDWISLTFM